MFVYTFVCVVSRTRKGQERCVAVTQLIYIFSTNLSSYKVVGEFVIRQSVIVWSNMPITIKSETEIVTNFNIITIATTTMSQKP